jgi:xanthine dehydrogenase accessory factor
VTDVFEEIAALRERGERAALATVISTTGSTPGRETMRLLVRESGEIVGSVGGGCVEAEVVVAAKEVLESDVARRLEFRLTEEATGAEGLMCGGLLEVFVEPVSAPHALLFGAGHVSRSLSRILADAGFRVTVVDDRAAYANPERFPEAKRLVVADTFAGALAEVRVPAGSACIVLTRGHSMDQECLDFALHSPASYVGMIGSKVKVRGMLARLRDAGRLDGVDLSRLHAPIGIDTGGGTHGEIAVAIAAEVVAHRRRRLEGLRCKRLSPEEVARIAARGPRVRPPEAEPRRAAPVDPPEGP